jgi:hypothetical protein
VFALLAAFALVVLPSIAWADKNSDAKAHFKKGKDAYSQARYQEAIAEFEQANTLRPAAVLHFNIAQAYEKLGDIPKALTSYHTYLREDPAASDAASVNVAIHNLEKRLAERGVQQLLVYSSPVGATVAIDGHPSGPTPLAIELPPGTHQVLLSKDGYINASKQVVTSTDKSLELDFTLQKGTGAPLVIAADPITTPDVPKADPKPDPKPDLTPKTDPNAVGGVTTPAVAGKSHTFTYITAAVTGAALITAVVLGAAASSSASSLRDGQTRNNTEVNAVAGRAKSQATASNVFYGVSAAGAIATGAVFFAVEGGF